MPKFQLSYQNSPVKSYKLNKDSSGNKNKRGCNEGRLVYDEDENTQIFKREFMQSKGNYDKN